MTLAGRTRAKFAIFWMSDKYPFNSPSVHTKFLRSFQGAPFSSSFFRADWGLEKEIRIIIIGIVELCDKCII